MAHILVVDDSATDAHMIRAALEGAGHRVSVAITADEGIALARSLQPNLIIMDVVFQGTSGFQAVRRLVREPETARIPVVIMSGKGMDTDRAWGMRQGAVEYLVKPIRPKELVDSVTKVLEGSGGGSAGAGAES